MLTDLQLDKKEGYEQGYQEGMSVSKETAAAYCTSRAECTAGSRRD